jgi:hypothetical protein
MNILRRGNIVLIVALVLVAVIPICVYFVIVNRNQSADYQIRKAQLVTSGSVTAQVREVEDIDKYGKKFRYWVVDLASHIPETLFNCYIAFSSKGEQQLFYGFSKNYANRDCNLIANTRYNYECRISNAINKMRNSDSSRRWDKIPGQGHLVIGVSRFYKEQTVDKDSFFLTNKLSDIYSVIASCQTPKGNWVRQEILDPPIVPLPK